MSIIEFLGGIPIFGGLDQDELSKVAGYLRQRAYDAGEVIVREGEQARELFIVRRGQVEIYKELAGESAEARIASLGEGECFGEMSLIDIMPRSASVRAASDTQVMSLSYSDFHALCVWRMETFTMLVMNIAREISRRLRVADSILAEYNIRSRR
jgi:CRP-like cAMP-binding protein